MNEPGVCKNGALNNQHTKPQLQRPVLFRFIKSRVVYGPRLEGALTGGSALTRGAGSYYLFIDPDSRALDMEDGD